jgi:hypothetical protein
MLARCARSFEHIPHSLPFATPASLPPGRPRAPAIWHLAHGPPARQWNTGEPRPIVPGALTFNDTSRSLMPVSYDLLGMRPREAQLRLRLTSASAEHHRAHALSLPRTSQAPRRHATIQRSCPPRRARRAHSRLLPVGAVTYKRRPLTYSPHDVLHDRFLGGSAPKAPPQIQTTAEPLSTQMVPTSPLSNT